MLKEILIGTVLLTFTGMALGNSGRTFQPIEEKCEAEYKNCTGGCEYAEPSTWGCGLIIGKCWQKRRHCLGQEDPFAQTRLGSVVAKPRPSAGKEQAAGL